MEEFTGSKYGSVTDAAQIAKAFRADVKEAQKSGKLPKGLKLSVKIERFAGGQAVSVRIVALAMQIQSPGWIAEYIANPRNSTYHGRITGEANYVKLTLDEMLNAYNSKRTDSMSDYFYRLFWDSVEFDNALLHAEIEAARAAEVV